MTELAAEALFPIWFVVVLVTCIAATVGVTVPLTVKFCDRRTPVHPAVTFDPSYTAHLNAARAQADTYLQEMRVMGGVMKSREAAHERQLAIAWAHSEKLRQRALRAARSNRLARNVIRELVGWDGREVRRWAHMQGLI